MIINDPISFQTRGEKSLFFRVLERNIFVYFSCTSNSGEVKPDPGADQLKGTNKA